MLTDFDQRRPDFGHVGLFTLDQVLSSPELAAIVGRLKKLYGHFEWEMLDRFSYIEHQGDVIVTNETYNVTGGNVFIKSTIEDSIITASSLHKGSESDKKELENLLKQLQTELSKTPAGKEEEAKTAAVRAKGLVDEAVLEKPDEDLLHTLSVKLKGAASFLKDVVPAVATLSTQIIALVARVHGLAL